MSGADNEIVCPKCGYKGTNPQVCEACGVILERLRGRQDPGQRTDVSDQGTAPPGSFYRPAYGGVEPVASGARNVFYVALVLGVCIGFGGWYYYQRTSASHDGLIRQHRSVVARTLKILDSSDSDDRKSRDLDDCADRVASLRDKVLKLKKMGSFLEITRTTSLLAANEVLREELDAISDALDSGGRLPSSPAPMKRVTALLDVAQNPTSVSAMEKATAIMRPVAPGAARTLDRSQQLFDQRADDVREAEEFSATPQDREQAVKDFDQRFGRAGSPPGVPRTPSGGQAAGPATDDQKIIEAARRDAQKYIDNVRRNPFADVVTSAPLRP